MKNDEGLLFCYPQPDIGMDEYLRPSHCISPEHYLIIAILEDAIDNLRKDDSKLRREAVKWIRGKGKRFDPDYIFTFDNCCEALGLNPGKARAKILNLTGPPISEFCIERSGQSFLNGPSAA